MENFWKEYTFFLPAKKEFIYDVQNKNTNCVIIRNYNLAKIKAGTKPHTYEVFLNPNRTGFLNRPFPLNYIHLIANKKTPISVIETVTKNPINNFIQQKITKNIIAQNAPQVCEEAAYKQLSITHIEDCPPRQRPIRWPVEHISVTLDCGPYGRPLVNIVLASCGVPTFFRIGFSNDNDNYFLPYYSQNVGSPYCGGNFHDGHFYPAGFIRNHINLINAFRFVRVVFEFWRFSRRGHFVYVHISGKRCHTKNRRQLVTQQDGF